MFFWVHTVINFYKKYITITVIKLDSVLVMCYILEHKFYKNISEHFMKKLTKIISKKEN